MEYSKRISSLESSPTVALNTKAKAMVRDGIDVLNFAVGEPDFSTPKYIVDEAIKALENGKTKYGPPGGSPDLRKAISEKLKRENKLEFSPDSIVCGTGAKQIILHTFLAVCNEGDEILVPAPYWVSYPEQIKAAGATPVVVPMQGLKKPITAEGLEKAKTNKTRGLVLNSPNNPGGFLMSQEDLTEIAEWLRKNPDIWVLSDEIYEYMVFGGEHISLLNVAPDLKDRVFYVNGFSKGYAMTGWRVGYVAGPDEGVRLIKLLQSQSSTCLPPFIEAGAIVAVDKGKPAISAQLDKLAARRDLTVKLLNEIPGIEYMEPQGAFYAFIDCRDSLKNHPDFGPTNTLAFGEHLLLKHHIAVVPGEAFGAAGFLRFSYATDEKTITEGLERFKKAIEEIRSI